MTSYRKPRTCINPRCMEDLSGSRYSVDLCPSCRFVGRVAFALGAVIAGALVRWLAK